jgi:hypothetical protein
MTLVWSIIFTIGQSVHCFVMTELAVNFSELSDTNITGNVLFLFNHGNNYFASRGTH